MPQIHVLWYLDKYSFGSGYSDAVVVVDDTPAIPAKIAMSNLCIKVAFLAVSTIKREDLGNAVGGALQHAIIMRYMLEADETEQRATQLQLWIPKKSGFSVAFHRGFWTATEGMKGTSRCMLQRPSRKMS